MSKVLRTIIFMIESTRQEKRMRQNSFMGIGTEFNIVVMKLGLLRILGLDDKKEEAIKDKQLKAAYKEFCNCGFKGSFLEYIKKVGLEDED